MCTRSALHSPYACAFAELELSPNGPEKSKGDIKASGSATNLSSAGHSNQSSQQALNTMDKGRAPPSPRALAPTALGKSLFGPDEPAIWKQVRGRGFSLSPRCLSTSGAQCLVDWWRGLACFVPCHF